MKKIITFIFLMIFLFSCSKNSETNYEDNNELSKKRDFFVETKTV